MMILGVSCHYHDSAACLVEDGRIVAAVEEERLTRRKHDASFPERAIRFCLERGGLHGGRLDAMAFYEQPALKLHRILATHARHAPRGLRSLGRTLREWGSERLWMRERLQTLLAASGVQAPEKLYSFRHHESHAASAFYPSPFDAAAILTIDGVGEWATTTLATGRGRRIRLLREQYFPHSLGLLYSAFTQFTGFRVNSGEYKVMGLAPYGEPRFRSTIERELIELDADGFFRLNTDYFDFEIGEQMINERFARLFGGPPRHAESPLTQREIDLARSIQEVVEEVVLRLARTLRSASGERDLCMAGGVALNCVANGRLLRSGLFDRIWIQPAAGDAGGAVGAALGVWFDRLGNRREVDSDRDGMAGSLLGPEYGADEIKRSLEAHGLRYTCVPDAEWASTVAALIAAEEVVALHQGRTEFGPRSLGNRSIVGDARSPRMQSVMNLKVKRRESFRPFAPACLARRADEYFDLGGHASPYMLLVAEVRKDRRCPMPPGHAALPLQERLALRRSDIPAVTHVDFSARVQTVSADLNPRFYALLEAFDAQTGCGVIINTSFNVRGEPMVCSPDDACRCFLGTAIDTLAIGPFLVRKAHQSKNLRFSI